jgi:5'-nucleotidase/UDP-sugar diphosphatase
MKREVAYPVLLFAAIAVLVVIIFVILRPAPVSAPAAESVVHITIMQLNDVYEITPVSGGAQGGLARVATVRNDLLAENPNTVMILSGDLFSPSALGTAPYENGRLAGRQMVAVMNEIGLDYATFGNHEFDLDRDQFLARLAESSFTWFSSNVTDAGARPFPGVSPNVVFTVAGEAGHQIQIGLFGLTLNSNQSDYVAYDDPIETARQQVQALQGEVDILIAVTHLPIDQDIQLAGAFPELDLILGGHEHENNQVWRGADLTPIFKADANARTVYVHELFYNTTTGQLDIESKLLPITDDIPDDPAAADIVQQWVDIGFAGFRAQGFDPERVVTAVTDSLDGLEASVRNQPTALTDLIAAGMLNAVADAELAIFNGGSIRIDDVIPPGEITEYDVIRILPFGGTVLSVEMQGDLLQQVLNQGQANRGSGGYLQTANVERDGSTWLINGRPLDTGQTYTVAINDFLVSGREQNLGYLSQDNAGLRVVAETVDVRQALIDQLQATYGTN